MFTFIGLFIAVNGQVPLESFHVPRFVVAEHASERALARVCASVFFEVLFPGGCVDALITLVRSLVFMDLHVIL